MKKILLALWLLTFTIPAFAVGTMIVAAFYNIGAAAIASTFTAGMYAAAFAINFAVSTIVSRAFGPKPPKMRDNGVRQQIPPATVNSLPIIYGDAYAGGVYVDAALSQNQKTMYHVFAISCISPNGQFSFDRTKFYYGDRLITFDATDQTKVISLTDGSGNVDTKINNKLFINLYTSTESGVITSANGANLPSVVMENFVPIGIEFKGYVDNYADLPSSPAVNDGYVVRIAYSNFPTVPTFSFPGNSFLVWNGSSWTITAVDYNKVPPNLAWPSSGRQMNGLAFAIVKLVYNIDAGTTSLQPITFRCSHYLNNQGVARPGDVWLDYIKSPIYGGAVDVTFIDSASATALNTYSDETITFTPSGGGTATQARYRINGVLDTGENVINNVNKILDACDSWMAYDAAKGQWSIVVNKAEGSSFAFNDSNIIGDIRVSAVDINQAINQIEASFPNKLNKDIPAYVNIVTPPALLYPNEPVNKASVTYDLVNNNVQAYYLANRQLEQAREDLIVIFKTTYVGIQVNAGDVISITNTAYGWSSKLFRAVKVNETSLPDGTLGAQIEAHEYNAQVYDNFDITAFSPSPNSDIPNIGFFGTLTAPVVTDQEPNAAIPTFSVDVTIPSTGQINIVSLYYTTVAAPVETDWTLWGVQQTTSSSPYTNGSTLKFPHIGLPTATYYFAFTVGNQVARSELSPKSSAYTWLPNPLSSAVAGTFIAQFSPGSLGVPYDGTTATFTGLAPQLYGTTAGGSVDFVASQTDSDAAFVANTWRIGNSSTTGYADIVKSGITIANPTDAGFYALFPTPTAMSANPATLSVPVRYKAADGTVTQGATAIQQFVYAIIGDQGDPGADGTKSAEAYLYQWSTVTPANPNGNSTFTWATATNSSYSGGNGWTTTVPSNPGTPGIKLWRAAKGVTAAATAATTTVSWTSGFAVTDITQNGVAGANGTQAAKPSVFQWAATIPSAPSGSSTYTWATGAFTPTPAGWTLTPGTSPSAGYTLWQAQVSLIESATTTTSTINWTTASIFAAGYAGTNGTNGANGTDGAQGVAGASARVMYARIAGSPSPVTGTVTVTGDVRPTGAQGSAVWGASFNVTWSANDPTPTSNNTLWQADGIYNPATNQTAWSTPYISNLKVGSLSAITVNTGALTVTGTITAQSGATAPAISGTTMTGAGAAIYSDGRFVYGNSTRNLNFNGTTLTMNGDLVVTGNIQNNQISKAAVYRAGTTIINNFPSTVIANVASNTYWKDNASPPQAVTVSGITSNTSMIVIVSLTLICDRSGSTTDRANYIIRRSVDNGASYPYTIPFYPTVAIDNNFQAETIMFVDNNIPAGASSLTYLPDLYAIGDVVNINAYQVTINLYQR